MKILVTGGAGYIGSHTVVELLENNYEVVIVDNFSNSKPEVLEKIFKIAGKEFKFYEGDVCDKELLRKIFIENKIDATIHFAGFKAVGESVANPLMYYQNNLLATINLLEVMNDHNSKRIVFSSSATVYKESEQLPLKENYPLQAVSPYGNSKLFVENVLKDIYKSDSSWGISILRYFNPIGSHHSGLIGEDTNGIPNNLMPYIVKVATKELKELSVFGNDYDTKDGTGVRDYIHVVDLAKGHLKAIEYIINNEKLNIFNLGTGTGYSVMDLINTFSHINNVEVPYKIVERRAGDIAEYYADSSYAKEVLGWEASLGLDDMCRDSYNYAVSNIKLSSENKSGKLKKEDIEKK